MEDVGKCKKTWGNFGEHGNTLQNIGTRRGTLENIRRTSENIGKPWKHLGTLANIRNFGKHRNIFGKHWNICWDMLENIRHYLETLENIGKHWETKENIKCNGNH